MAAWVEGTGGLIPPEMPAGAPCGPTGDGFGARKPGECTGGGFGARKPGEWIGGNGGARKPGEWTGGSGVTGFLRFAAI